MHACTSMQVLKFCNACNWQSKIHKLKDNVCMRPNYLIILTAFTHLRVPCSTDYFLGVFSKNRNFPAKQ